MLKTSLSKQEAKYRIKFIQEHNYNKQEQNQFDEAISNSGMSYKAFYKSVRSGDKYLFMVTIAGNRVIKSMKKTIISVLEANHGISDFINVMCQNFSCAEIFNETEDVKEEFNEEC